MKRIFINKDKCVGCFGCLLACMSEHNVSGGKSVYELNLADPHNSPKNNVLADSCGNPVPVFCRHCSDPECVRTCMSGAMSKNSTTGYVAYDSTHCASCYMCVMSCPYGVLKVDCATQKVIQKCDNCEDRGSPRCVDECPTKALELKEV